MGVRSRVRMAARIAIVAITAYVSVMATVYSAVGIQPDVTGAITALTR